MQFEKWFLREKLTLKDSNILYQFYIKSPFFSKMSITTVIIIINRKKSFKSHFIFQQLFVHIRVYWHPEDCDLFLANPVSETLYAGCIGYCITELYFKINNSIIINALKQNKYALPSYFIVEPEFGRYSKGWK